MRWDVGVGACVYAVCGICIRVDAEVCVINSQPRPEPLILNAELKPWS